MRNKIGVHIPIFIFTSLIYIFGTNIVAAEVTKPEIKTRAEWGADEDILENLPENIKHYPMYKKVTHLVIHHTTDSLPEGIETGKTGPERVRNIFNYHATKFGDIGYNAIIDADGTIYEGTKGSGGKQILQDGVEGAHAFGFNKHTFSVALLGNFNNYTIPDEMRKSLVHLLAYEAQVWKIDPIAQIDFVRTYHSTLSEVIKAHVPESDKDIYTIQGHGQLPRQCTDCPGKFVKADILQTTGLTNEKTRRTIT